MAKTLGRCARRHVAVVEFDSRVAEMPAVTCVWVPANDQGATPCGLPLIEWALRTSTKGA